MNEERFLELLKNQIEDIDVPSSINSEQILEKLENIEHSVISEDVLKASRDIERDENEFKTKKSYKRLIFYISSTVGAVAVLAIIMTAMFFGRNNGENDINKGVNSESQYVERDTTEDVHLEEDNNEAESLNVDSDNPKTEQLTCIESYEHLKGVVKYDNKENRPVVGPSFEMAGDDGSDDGDESSADTSIPGYLSTNVRTEGVDEGDCIKTDGEYIYIYNEDEEKLSIVKANGKDTEYISSKNIFDMVFDYYNDYYREFELQEIMLYDNKIVIMGSTYDEREMLERKNSDDTLIVVVDINDKTDFFVEKCFIVSGEYTQSRLNDDYLYVYSTYTIRDENHIKPYVDGAELEHTKVFNYKSMTVSEYTIMTSVDLSNESKVVDSKAIVTNGDVTIYASEKNVYYIYGYNDLLKIVKFSYAEGIFTPIAGAKVKGIIEDVFCVDEYEDNLRILVTWEYWNKSGFCSINTLYVLDESMNMIGKIDNIAPGEEIYSARYDGDLAYFVTYKQMDPLFSVDLSEPENPKLIGRLKIPGYSEYMHLWNDTRLFGIGIEGERIKMSMFDIENATNLKEKAKEIIDAYSSDSLYDHRAMLVSGEKNIIGFLVKEGIDKSSYYIYSYENEKFVKKQQINIKCYENIDVRGMYIGEYVYVVSEKGEVYIIVIDDYEVIKEIRGD